jgi:hypothetical protein
MRRTKTIYELLIDACERRRFFVGGDSIHALENLAHGYMSCLAYHGIVEDDVPSMEPFLWWLVETKPGSWSAGWATEIENQTCGDADAAFARIRTYLEEFSRFTAVLASAIEIKPNADRSLMHCQYHAPTARVPSSVNLIRLTPKAYCYANYCFGSQHIESQKLLYESVDIAKRYEGQMFGLDLMQWQDVTDSSPPLVGADRSG